jgi:hypothetical protein
MFGILRLLCAVCLWQDFGHHPKALNMLLFSSTFPANYSHIE